MFRTLKPTLAEAQREGVIALGRRNAVPTGEDVALEDRTRAGLGDDARWAKYKEGFTALRCKLRGAYLGNNHPQYASQPLFALEVKPLQRLPTTQPPNTATPYHVSVAFWDKKQREDFAALQQRFASTREVTLRGKIHGSIFELDPLSCPVGSDPLVRRVHQNGHYANRPLHVSL